MIIWESLTVHHITLICFVCIIGDDFGLYHLKRVINLR